MAFSHRITDETEIKCCRCRHKHLYKERIDKPCKWHGAHVMKQVCPRCQANDFTIINQQ